MPSSVNRSSRVAATPSRGQATLSSFFHAAAKRPAPVASHVSPTDSTAEEPVGWQPAGVDPCACATPEQSSGNGAALGSTGGLTPSTAATRRAHQSRSRSAPKPRTESDGPGRGGEADRDSRTPSDKDHNTEEDCAVGELLGLPSYAAEERVVGSGAAPVAPASRTLFVRRPAAPTQTFLDLGQSASLTLGRTCKRCGMLFTNLDEDVRLHQRVCRSLAGRVSGQELAPLADRSLAESAEAVRVLEELHAASAAGGRALDRLHTRRDPVVQVVACEKQTHRPQRRHGDLSTLSPTAALDDGNTTYTLRCASPGVRANPRVIHLLNALGLVDDATHQAEDIVAIVVSHAVQRVVAAAVGRPSTRAQEPELVVERLPSGHTHFSGFRSRSTRFDVRAMYLARAPLLTRIAATRERHSTAAALASQREALRRFFTRPDPTEAERRRRQAERRVVDEGSRALCAALVALAATAVYGQRLEPRRDFSFARRAVGQAPGGDSHAAEGVAIPSDVLLRAVGAASGLDGEAEEGETVAAERENVDPEGQNHAGDVAELFYHSEGADDVSDTNSETSVLTGGEWAGRSELDDRSVASYGR